MRFTDKAVLVTGGSSGIGAACVAAFQAEGAVVASADLHPIASPAVNVAHITGDVSDAAQAARIVDDAVNVMGRIDILVNSAGIGSLTPSESLSPLEWRKTISTNLDGTFFMAQAVIRHMLSFGMKGSIVNIGSVCGHVSFHEHAAYTASKGAVANLTRALGIEFAARGIRVNSVSPGFVLTPLIASQAGPDVMTELASLHPIGRMASPAEIAGPVLFLASEDASFVVGADIMVDGGYTAR